MSESTRPIASSPSRPNPFSPPQPCDAARPAPDGFVSASESPFLRAPEEVSTIHRVTMAAAALPLLGGAVLFGWRAVMVAAISVASCALTERLYYWATRSPALLGRSHAYLTGLLLAMTLPAGAEWYVPAVAGAFAIIVGKAVFGGVGHFLWQPALVGRLAAAVFFASTLNPPLWPVLAQDKLFWGDVRQARDEGDLGNWLGRSAPAGQDARLMPSPANILSGATSFREPVYCRLGYPPETDVNQRPRPTLIGSLPPMLEVLIGARGGGVGETPILLLVLGGLYLIYRKCVKWQLPASMLAAAAAVAMAAPVWLAGPGEAATTVWWPALSEESEVGLLYVCYQLFSGGLVLAAFFMATEMTSRPVTARGQVVFGAGCGALAMLIQMYGMAPFLFLIGCLFGNPQMLLKLNFYTPIPAYMAVIAMNTFTPAIEAICRPRVLGMKRLAWLRK